MFELGHGDEGVSFSDVAMGFGARILTLAIRARKVAPLSGYRLAQNSSASVFPDTI